MAVLTSQFEILRGWPDGSAVAEDFTVAATTVENPHTAGKWVSLDASSPTEMKTEDVNPSSSATTRCYLIIEGLENFPNSGSKMHGKVTCMLGGGYTVRLHNLTANEQFAATDTDDDLFTYTPGTPVRVGERKDKDGSVIMPAFFQNNGDAVDALAADGYGAADVANLEARAAVVGHVVRHDSANDILEVYIR